MNTRKLKKYIIIFLILPFIFLSCSKDNESSDPIVEGCTDPTALNYDSNANTDDGSCQYSIVGEWEISRYYLGSTNILSSYQYMYKNIFADGTYNITGVTTSNENLDVSGVYSIGGLFNHEITFINEFGDTGVFTISQITGSFIAMTGIVLGEIAEIEAVRF